jgi:iron complex transport system substrate-binding protein
MNFSDYPEAAKRLPLIGSDAQIDLERVLALRPICWWCGRAGTRHARSSS